MDTSCKSDKNDKVQSTVHCLQIFSDKFQISLSAGSLKFYPLRVVLYYTDKERRRKVIVKGNYIVIYLATLMQVENIIDSTDKSLGNKTEKITKKASLESFCPNVLSFL